MELNSICQTPNCTGKALFYCEKCDLHLCFSCKNKDYPKHKENLINLENIISQDKLKEVKKQIELLNNKLRENTKHYEEFLQNLEFRLNEGKKFLENLKLENDYLNHYYSSLILTYETAKIIVNSKDIDRLVKKYIL